MQAIHCLHLLLQQPILTELRNICIVMYSCRRPHVLQLLISFNIVHGLPAKQSWTSLLLCHWHDVLVDTGMMDLLQNASTALHCAAWEAHPVTVELLLQKQADIQVCTAGRYINCWCLIFTWCLAACQQGINRTEMPSLTALTSLVMQSTALHAV